MFKKTTLALLTASLFISTSALAISNNTITFRGQVSDETVLWRLTAIRQNR